MTLPRARKFIWQLALAGAALGLLSFRGGLERAIITAGWPAVAGVAGATLEIMAWATCGWLAISLIGILLWVLWERPTGRPWPKLLHDIISTTVIFTIVISILGSVFKVPLSGLVAGSSVVAAVVGLALSRMISDVFSGLALNLEKSYSVDDWLEIEMRHRPGGALTGRVAEINWRATRLLTLANEVAVIPNSEMARARFVNYSLPEKPYRTEVQVHLSHAVPSDRAKRILLAAVRSAPGVLLEPEPFISLVRFDQAGVLWAARFWIEDYVRQRPVVDAVHEAILRHLQVAGINISYNRIEQRLIKADASELNMRPVREALVGRVDLFTGLTTTQIAQLAEGLEECNYGAGADIVRQGASGASLYIVAEGLVDILVTDEHGQETWVAHIEPGGYFGEMSLLTGQPRTASARAKTEAVCYKVTKETLEPIFQTHPELLERISGLMAERRAELCRIQEGAEAEVCALEEEKGGNWLLTQMQRFFGIKRG